MASSRRIPKDVDWLMLGATLALALIGVAFIHSAKISNDAPGLAPEAVRQLVALGIAVVAMGVILRFDYGRLLALAPWFYGVGLLGLLSVFAFGTEIGGNKAWLHVFGLSIQPSEPMKVATLLMLASVIPSREGIRLRDIVVQGLIVGVPFLIVKVQDTGTALTFLPLLAASIFVSGLRWRWMLAGAVALALATPVVWHYLDHYKKERIEVVLNPDLDPKGKGYHSIQSRIAVGSGGMLGQGYLKGPQNRLGFLPERHTDYIFAIIAEEWGFLRELLVLALYMLLLRRLVDAAVLARDRQGAILCVGALAFIGVHLMVNVGMVIGLLPTIGIPLPLLSFGGSSLIAFACIVALAANVRMRRLAR
jgi:rod shape determining protein RodA